MQTFVSKVMSLTFNTLICHGFSSKEKESFNFMAAVTVHCDFGDQEEEICHTSTFSPSICHEVMRPDAMILIFLNIQL